MNFREWFDFAAENIEKKDLEEFFQRISENESKFHSSEEIFGQKVPSFTEVLKKEQGEKLTTDKNVHFGSGTMGCKIKTWGVETKKDCRKSGQFGSVEESKIRGEGFLIRYERNHPGGSKLEIIKVE